MLPPLNPIESVSDRDKCRFKIFKAVVFLSRTPSSD